MMLLTNAAPIINSFTLFAVGEREATPFEEEPLSSQSKIELINRLKAGMGDKREEVRLRSLSDLLEFDFTARDRFRYILRKPLLEALEDESAAVAWEAAKAFAHLLSCSLSDFGHSTVENLIQVLAKGKKMTDAEKSSLGNIIQNSRGGAAIALGKIILTEIPEELKIKAVNPLISLSKGGKRPSDRYSAIWALGNYAWTNLPLDLKRKIIVTLANFLGGRGEHVRYFSAAALRLFVLSDIPSEDKALIVKCAVKAQRIERNLDVKRILMELMADLAGSVPSEAKLELGDPIEKAVQSPDAEIRDSATRGVIYLGRRFFSSQLKEQIQKHENDLNSKDASVRAIAILTLSNLSRLNAAKYSRAKVLNEVLEAVKDKATIIRMAGVRSLRKFLNMDISEDSKNKALYALIGALSGPSGNVRSEAEQVCSMINPLNLIEFLNDEKEEIRNAANSELLKIFGNNKEKLLEYIKSNLSFIADRKSIFIDRSRHRYDYDFSQERPIKDYLILKAIESKPGYIVKNRFIKRLLLTVKDYSEEMHESSALEKVAFAILFTMANYRNNRYFHKYLRKIPLDKKINIKIRRVAARLLGYVPSKYTEAVLKEVLGVGLFTPRDEDEELCEIAFKSLKMIRRKKK